MSKSIKNILDVYANIILNLDEISELTNKQFYNILFMWFSMHFKL